MPTMYEEFDVRRFFSAAPFTRARHAFRGRRESHKINLEIDQMWASLKKLYTSFNADKQSHINTSNFFSEGGEVDGVTGEGATPEAFTVFGLKDIRSKLSNIEAQIRILER